MSQQRKKKPIEFETLEHYNGFLRYLEHGSPHPLVRWHCHDECELHLITSTSGKAFIGDYIGDFAPGQLVLTGSRLPHNWISANAAENPVPLRDMLVQFALAPLEAAAKGIPELREIIPLLERAKYGVEFFGMSKQTEAHLIAIKENDGIARFSRFIECMGELARCPNYRLLSTVQLQSAEDEAALAKVNLLINFLTENYKTAFTLSELSERVNMSESTFSRFFRRATGNSMTDFVNRLRINKACMLLMETDKYITNVCYDVGFNNVANFNRRFLEIKGMTPREFRKAAEKRHG